MRDEALHRGPVRVPTEHAYPRSPMLHTAIITLAARLMVSQEGEGLLIQDEAMASGMKTKKEVRVLAVGKRLIKH